MSVADRHYYYSVAELSVSSLSDDEQLTATQQICRSGYTLEQATKALELCDDNLEAAIQHLLSAEINMSSLHDIDQSDDNLEILRYYIMYQLALNHFSLYFSCCAELKITDSPTQDTLTIAELGGVLDYIPRK